VPPLAKSSSKFDIGIWIEDLFLTEFGFKFLEILKSNLIFTNIFKVKNKNGQYRSEASLLLEN